MTIATWLPPLIAPINSSSWTGRAPYAGSPIDVLRRALSARLYPSYECEQCVGQEPWLGCYCQHYGAVAPGIGPEAWRAWLRRVLGMEEQL